MRGAVPIILSLGFLSHVSRCSLALFLVAMVCQGQEFQARQNREVRSGFYQGKQITYEIINSWAIFEGDILLGKAEEIARNKPPELIPDQPGSAPKAAVVSGPTRHWPGATVPYVIDAPLVGDSRITDAIAHWNTRTPLSLVPRNSETDYVRFVETDPDCFSAVGLVGGEQIINIESGCSTGNTIDEIGHTVGYWHT